MSTLYQHPMEWMIRACNYDQNGKVNVETKRILYEQKEY